MPPLVSILIPAYDAERWMADTIRSALAQNWPRKEIIIVDDGSTDQTLSIARQFASKTVSVIAQKNQGPQRPGTRLSNSARETIFTGWMPTTFSRPTRLAKQVAAAQECQDKRRLLSSRR